MAVKRCGILVKTFLSMLGVVLLIDAPLRESDILVYGILFMSFLGVYTQRTGKYEKTSNMVALLFTMFVFAGNDCLGKMVSGNLFDGIFVLAAIAGVWFIFQYAVEWIFQKYDDKLYEMDHIRTSKEVKGCFLVSFLIIMGVYSLFFLNGYPGTLSTDTPAQLAQAVGDNGFENANPLINTLLITACVRSCLALGGSVSAGVGLYTFVQMTLFALIEAYAVSVIYKKGFRKVIVWIAMVFWAVMPYNIVYATGMWKDSFFAITFLLTIVHWWNVAGDQEAGRIHYILLAVMALVCSLARTSGWTSLLVGGGILVLLSWKKNGIWIRSACSVLIGVGASFLVSGFIYPLLIGETSSNINTALSVPFQQVARVISVGCELTEEEISLINQVTDIEKVPVLYEETISDPIKWSVDKHILREHLGEYAKLWVDLGIRYPKCYLDAYVALTKNYWYPDASSWTWDTRIFENAYGVERKPVIFPDKDFYGILDRIYSFPKSSVFKNSSTIAWLTLLSIGICVRKKNRFALALLSAIIFIYIGLMFTSPVALFRYTYGAAICVPLIICFMEEMCYLQQKKEQGVPGSENEAKCNTDSVIKS